MQMNFLFFFFVGSEPALKAVQFLFGGTRVAHVVQALGYKPGGRGIDSRWCYWISSLT